MSDISDPALHCGLARGVEDEILRTRIVGVAVVRMPRTLDPWLSSVIAKEPMVSSVSIPSRNRACLSDPRLMIAPAKKFMFRDNLVLVCFV